IGRIAVAGIFLDMQINNQNGVKILRGEILDHLLERRKALAVDGEGGIAFMVVDIEVDRVARNLYVAESFRDFADTCFGIVGIAALLETESPIRRELRVARQSGEHLHDLFWFGAR